MHLTHLWQSEAISGATKYDVVPGSSVAGPRGATEPSPGDPLIIIRQRSRLVVRVYATADATDARHPSSLPRDHAATDNQNSYPFEISEIEMEWRVYVIFRGRWGFLSCPLWFGILGWALFWLTAQGFLDLVRCFVCNRVM